MRWTVALLILLGGTASLTAQDAVNFDRDVAPLLAGHCLDCHNADQKKGGLDLSQRKAAFAGGDSGGVLSPGNLEKSLLWERVAAGEMPPKQKLTAGEKNTIRRWIAGGAKWGTDPIDPFQFTTRKRAGYDWWSLQPVKRPAVPNGRGSWSRNAVDAFVLRALRQRNLTPSAAADRRTLVRRVYFDLLGIPPTPEEATDFISDDSPDAYERLVNRLLASPRYGERWARHWLDVARFGESQGFERDKLRPHAWRYRDWVIAALNADMPYDEFTRLQIAGDVMHPNDGDAITATGFLVAAPYDEVGQNQQSAAMKAVVRQDELEDLVGTVGQTFLGLTVNCARCHDHKFDPIRQKEYYQLTAALSGVRHGERAIKMPSAEAEHKRLIAEWGKIRRRQMALEQTVINQIRAARSQSANEPQLPRPISSWDFRKGLRDQIGSLHGSLQGGARLTPGGIELNGSTAFVSTAALQSNLTEKTLEVWVRLDNLSQRGGGAISVQTTDGVVFDSIVFGEREPQRWMAGSNGFSRTKPFQAASEDIADKKVVHVAITYQADGTVTAFRNGSQYGKPYKTAVPIAYRKGKAHVVFGLRHGTTAGGNRMLAGKVLRASLYDRALTADEVAASANSSGVVTTDELLAKFTPEQERKHAAWTVELKSIEGRMGKVGNVRVYAANSRQPGPTHVLLRGSTANKGDIVSADGIASLRGTNADFGVAPDASDRERRSALANWIAGGDNPLFARVLVNRVWHYHFGAGLVATPNDFGFNGGRASHPELLDWLAADFAKDWSLKRLHRTIVLSATYRQSSRFQGNAAAVDAGNRFLWRMRPRRLEAEAVRDAILITAGEFNPQLGGPPFQDFKTFTRNTQFYEMIDPAGDEYNRRTIYRTWVRSGRSRFLDAFDCPDPSTTAPNRAVTTTPIQSLALLNNSFVLRMSDRLAERLAKAHPDHVKSQAAELWSRAYSREPEAGELAEATAFIKQFGLPALCRVVFNSNEFVFVE